MEPLVSIITPSYNSEKYLDAYFTSILEQNYQNFEVIFINDGSTDRTEEIVNIYIKKFEEKKYGLFILNKKMVVRRKR